MSSDKQTKAERFAQIKQQFVLQLPERLKSIRAAWDQVLKGEVAPAERYELVRLVHSLSGSCGSFGFLQLGKNCQKLEAILLELGDGVITPPVGQSIFDLLENNEMLLERGAESSHSKQYTPVLPAKKEQLDVHVFLLEDDKLLSEEVENQMRLFGYRVSSFETVEAAEKALELTTPDVLVTDVLLPEGKLAGPSFADKVGISPTVPTIFISARSDWSARLAAVRAGGSAYLSKPLDMADLMEQVDRVTGRVKRRENRILIVDDTDILAQHYAAVLEQAGMKTEVLTNPAQILDKLAVFQPDLVLLDQYMPECNGTEVAKVIRQCPAYLDIPIVYLSTEKAVRRQLKAMEVGADDFLEKPIDDEHLVAAVSIRARRFRDIKALMSRDSLTGLLNHISLKDALGRALAEEQRRGGFLSFAMLDIDHFKQVNDRYGHPVGDRVIRSLARLLTRRLRVSDVVGRYGGEEFGVIFPNTTPEAAQRVLVELLRDFGSISHASYVEEEFTVTFSAGVAGSVAHPDPEALIRAADELLYRAKAAGRNRVEGERSAHDEVRANSIN